MMSSFNNVSGEKFARIASAFLFMIMSYGGLAIAYLSSFFWKFGFICFVGLPAMVTTYLVYKLDETPM